ncbi:hypothetical protein P4123_10865 [Pseudomonas aeruginosa]|nr:hypothetical protein [Pseudomonas aeruginosa]
MRRICALRPLLPGRLRLLCCTALPALAAAWKPEENLEIVVAGGPGGGTDQLAPPGPVGDQPEQAARRQHRGARTRAATTAPKPSSTWKLAKGNAHKLVIGTNNVYLLPLVAGWATNGPT